MRTTFPIGWINPNAETFKRDGDGSKMGPIVTKVGFHGRFQDFSRPTKPSQIHRAMEHLEPITQNSNHVILVQNCGTRTNQPRELRDLLQSKLTFFWSQESWPISKDEHVFSCYIPAISHWLLASLFTYGVCMAGNPQSALYQGGLIVDRGFPRHNQIRPTTGWSTCTSHGETNAFSSGRAINISWADWEDRDTWHVSSFFCRKIEINQDGLVSR